MNEFVYRYPIASDGGSHATGELAGAIEVAASSETETLICTRTKSALPTLECVASTWGVFRD